MNARQSAFLYLVFAVALAFGPGIRTATASRQAASSTYPDPGTTSWEAAKPGQEQQSLAAALADLYHIANLGGWPRVGGGPLLRPDERDERAAVLRLRLEVPPVVGPDSARHDPGLVAAVRRFQARHGLAPDGIVGPLTVAALDVPAAERARQIALNMERLSWLPADRGSRHVLVNVPAGTLAMVDSDSVRGMMRAVVGRPARPTPSLVSAITALKLNPAWNIPQRLARLDVLPHLRKDPQYWREHNIRVFESWKEGAPELDPALIDWSAIRPYDLAYKLRQEPGPLNPLGRLKFLFDNPYRVFIHDTPSRERFDSPARFYSAGCVRIEDPDALAAFLLEGAGPRLRERFEAAQQDSGSRALSLPRPVPVYLVYWTAWVDPDGTVQFRDDIYGHDRELAASLFSPPEPVPAVALASPPADRAGVEVDEVGPRIVADAAALFIQGGSPEHDGLDAR